MGAWIETLDILPKLASFTVASYMGAWIETGLKIGSTITAESHPTWVRGLKLYVPSHALLSPRRILHGCVD